MSVLVDKLRDRDAIVAQGLFHTVPIMRQAADRIEHLEAMLNRCEMWLSTHPEGKAMMEAVRTAIGSGSMK